MRYERKPVDFTDGRANRHRYQTPKEREDGLRAMKVMRSRRYRATIRNRLHPSCNHDCGCGNPIDQPICGMCAVGLCE